MGYPYMELCYKTPPIHTSHLQSRTLLILWGQATLPAPADCPKIMTCGVAKLSLRLKNSFQIQGAKRQNYKAFSKVTGLSDLQKCQSEHCSYPTLLGSPPKAMMLSCAHCNAMRWSWILQSHFLSTSGFERSTCRSFIFQPTGRSLGKNWIISFREYMNPKWLEKWSTLADFCISRRPKRTPVVLSACKP